MTGVAKYTARVEAVNSLLCVGLDSDLARLPARFQGEALPRYAFNRWVIEQTHPYAAAYKLNSAFYEAGGERGLQELRLTIEYLRAEHPTIFTICDAKRGDIADTNEAYAVAILDRLGFDAITLHPYTGRLALQPFLDRADKVAIILCRTSNPDAGELQDLHIGDKPLWQVVAEKVSQEWNSQGNCMLVMGAANLDALRQVRSLVPEMTFLVPGVGAQGGDLAAALAAGLDRTGGGLIVNSSRGIIFAAEPGAAAQALRDAINQQR